MFVWKGSSLILPLVISFIVPAHNEAALLASTLSALHRAASESGQHYEIIVVNDSSTDDTALIATQHKARVMDVSHRHIAATRNSGAKAARGQTLVFVDADTQVSYPLLQAAIHSIRMGAVGGGAAVSFHGTSKRWAKTTAAALGHAFRWTKIAPGCFLFCTRAAFDQAGGFDETLFAGEDVKISRDLAKLGRFEILREKVLTSDRKIRTHGLRTHLRLVGGYMRHGRSILKDRRHLELWYGDRRNAP